MLINRVKVEKLKRATLLYIVCIIYFGIYDCLWSCTRKWFIFFLCPSILFVSIKHQPHIQIRRLKNWRGTRLIGLAFGRNRATNIELAARGQIRLTHDYARESRRRPFPWRGACVLVSCASLLRWIRTGTERKREKEKVEEEETEVGHRLRRRDATYTMRRDASAKRIGLVTSSFRKWPLPCSHVRFSTEKRSARTLQIHCTAN